MRSNDEKKPKSYDSFLNDEPPISVYRQRLLASCPSASDVCLPACDCYCFTSITRWKSIKETTNENTRKKTSSPNCRSALEKINEKIISVPTSFCPTVDVKRETLILFRLRRFNRDQRLFGRPSSTTWCDLLHRQVDNVTASHLRQFLR